MNREELNKILENHKLWLKDGKMVSTAGIYLNEIDGITSGK